MEAKLKATFKFPRAVLFSGHEFVKAEFRTVPKGFEDQARKDDRLEIRETKAEKKAAEVKPVEAAPVVDLTPDFTEEDKRVWEVPEKKPRSGRRKMLKDDDAEAEG